MREQHRKGRGTCSTSYSSMGGAFRHDSTFTQPVRGISFRWTALGVLLLLHCSAGVSLAATREEQELFQQHQLAAAGNLAVAEQLEAPFSNGSIDLVALHSRQLLYRYRPKRLISNLRFAKFRYRKVMPTSGAGSPPMPAPTIFPEFVDTDDPGQGGLPPSGAAPPS